jgi:hypothetical protein
MSTVNTRISDLKAAERDLQHGKVHAYGQKRLEIVAKLRRVQRQIAMLTEADRSPMELPEQSRRFG